MSELSARLATAELVDSSRQPRDTVRFGAPITLPSVGGPQAGSGRHIEIVGVDEADPARDRIAFTAPIAGAVLGWEVGDRDAARIAQTV
ncbi:MAG: GreA/GreB family elongation factor [Candidatus Binatia bacterium]